MFQLLEIRIVSRNWDRRMATAINQRRAAAEGTVDNELRGIARVIKSDDRPKKVVLPVCQVHKRILEQTRHNQPVYGAGFRRGYELLISGNKKLTKCFIPDKKRGLRPGDLRHCGAPLTTG
jgi:hypothetical protein